LSFLIADCSCYKKIIAATKTAKVTLPGNCFTVHPYRIGTEGIVLPINGKVTMIKNGSKINSPLKF
jgi:hypothetical protein